MRAHGLVCDEKLSPNHYQVLLSLLSFLLVQTAQATVRTYVILYRSFRLNLMIGPWPSPCALVLYSRLERQDVPATLGTVQEVQYMYIRDLLHFAWLPVTCERNAGPIGSERSGPLLHYILEPNRDGDT